MSTWTTLDLLQSIKDRAMFPDASSGSLGPASLLNFATEELLITLVPMILGVREKYYETYQDTVVSSSAAIPLPARATGGVLSAVQYIQGTSVRQLHPIDPSVIATTMTSNAPTNFYYENNSIVLYPTPTGDGSGTVRMRYFQRPNRLEQTINCAQVTSFDATTVTCAAVPSTWAIGNTVDFVPFTQSQATPYSINKAITGVASNVLTFAAVPSATAIGDWLALAEYTPIPEIPFEFQGVLAQASTNRGLQSIKDQAGLKAGIELLQTYQAAAVRLMTPRDQLGQKKVVSNWRCY